MHSTVAGRTELPEIRVHDGRKRSKRPPPVSGYYRIVEIFVGPAYYTDERITARTRCRTYRRRNKKKKKNPESFPDSRRLSPTVYDAAADVKRDDTVVVRANLLVSRQRLSGRVTCNVHINARACTKFTAAKK